MAFLIPTEEVSSAAELRELFDLEVGDVLERVVQVCAGEWRRQRDGTYRLWADSNWGEGD
jgi:hypothetical protein